MACPSTSQHAQKFVRSTDNVRSRKSSCYTGYEPKGSLVLTQWTCADDEKKLWQVVVGPRNQCWCLVVQLQQGLLRLWLWLTRQPTKCWMKLLENLNKDDPPAASGAGVKSVGATEAAGSGTAMGLSPEQRRWLVNAAEAMRTGQAVAPLALLANAPEVQTLVPVGGAGQRPGIVKLDTKEPLDDAMVVGRSDIGDEVNVMAELFKARGSGSQHGGGQGTPTHAEQRLVAHDGLSHQDLLEIEAMSEVQDKLKNEMAEERDIGASKLTDCTAVEFGDWIAVITPLMSDLNSTSASWCSLTIAQRYYELWRVASPLEHLRLKVETHPEAEKLPRTEQRAVTMLLAAVPEQIRRDVVASRKMSSVEIVFTLLCKYQPGGAQERTVLLRELNENKLTANAGVKEILNTLRTWRRNLGRASELGVQLPDPLPLMGLLSKWSDALCRVGGSHMAFRVAGMRQALALDPTPMPATVTEFAEHLQAEAKQLMLATPTPTTTSTVSTPSSTVAPDVKKKGLVKAAALTTPTEKLSNYKGKDLEDRDAEGECEEGREPETWKKGSYTDLSDGTIKELFIRDFSNSNHVELWAVDERGKTKIVEERRGTKSELENSEPVTVELAHGSTVLRKKKSCSTLLTSDDIEPILPVRLLIDHGFNLTWTSSGINIHHPRRGALRCWKRQGCPVMHREEALALMKDLEQLEVKSAVDDEAIAWWSERYPKVPKEVLKFMVGQNDKWEDLDHGGLPFNRHRRRQLETCRGVVLHLYAGGVQRAGFQVLNLDVTLGA
ncbi:unnamed protein product [Cladocopium goreaui]|uniref:Uncharacterized protein n=1 Tax=Cladocopium goreaui TaxID=2562237 RepID=A0A9P1C6J8_9DINO|nr:unnamed protein product [Cladocopium goreaui]